MKKSVLIALGIILMIIGPCTFVTGVVYTLMLPNIYEARARISVQDMAPKHCPDPCPHCSLNNPDFLRTQMALIQSKPILYEVVNRLNLQAEWGREGEKLPRVVALKILLNSSSVFQYRDTSLIVISVQRDTPKEAAQIANAIAAAYRDSRLDLVMKENRTIITQIEGALKEQQTRVEVAESALAQLQVELNIADDGDRNNDAANQLLLQQLEGDRLYAQAEMMEKENLLTFLAELDNKDLIERASHITVDPLMLKTVQQLKDIDVKLESLEAENLGPEHPEVKRYHLQKKALENALEQRLVAFQNGLETEYKLAKSNFDTLGKDLARVRSTGIQQNGEKYKPFRMAQTTLESEQFIYKQLEARARKEQIIREISKSPVEIIDSAEPNMRPVSPNLFTNTMMALGMSVAPTIAGIVLLIFGLRKRVVVLEEVRGSTNEF